MVHHMGDRGNGTATWEIGGHGTATREIGGMVLPHGGMVLPHGRQLGCYGKGVWSSHVLWFVVF